MTDSAAGSPRAKLRTGAVADQRPAPRPALTPPADSRSVPVRLVLLVALGALVLLAAFRPGGVTAVIGVPLAVTLPGAVLQPRFLPGLHTDPVTRWCLRIALSLGTWAVTGLAVGAAGIPVRSVWTIAVGVVLLVAVVIGEPEGERRFGRVPLRDAGWVVVVVLVATVVALGGRGLVAIAGDADGAGAVADGTSVVIGFADPTVPLHLAATGARATVDVLVTNAGDDALTLTVGGQVGRSLPWATVEVEVPAGATRTVEVTGGIPVCSDPQQAIVTIEGAGSVAPLSTIVPGAAAGTSCGSG